MDKDINIINCPECGAEINVSELLYHRAQDKLAKDFEEKNANKDRELQKKLNDLQAEQELLAKDKEAIHQQVDNAVKTKLMTTENNKFDKTYLITVLLLYFGACGGLWHVAFWSTFDINFLQYIGLTDIIKNFVTPFMQSAGLSLVIYFATYILRFINRHDNPESLFYGRGSNTKVGKFLNNWSDLFMILYVFGITALIIFEDYTKYAFLPMLIAIPFGIFFTNKGFLSRRIVNPDLRNGIITFIILLPAISFCNAKLQSLAIFDNRSYKFVSSIQLNNIDTTSRTKQLIGLKYLGSTNSQIFLSMVDNSEKTILNTSNVLFVSYKLVDNKKK